VAATLTTQHDRQVWPSLRPAPAPKPNPVPREQRKPVALADVRVGDTLSFLADDGVFRVVERVGEVVLVKAGVLVQVQTERGRCVLTRKNWERRAPRR
jgi:hypothetical protein